MNRLQRQILQAIVDIDGEHSIRFTDATQIAERLNCSPLEIGDNLRLMSECGLVWVVADPSGYGAQLLPAGREALRETRWGRWATWLENSGMRAGAPGWFSVSLGKLLGPVFRYVDDRLRRSRG